MDERDLRILKAIAELGTGSPEQINRATDIPVSTIHYRLNNLRQAGIIENDLYDLDLEELGLGVTVIVEVFADYSDSYDDVADQLLDIEGVTQAYFTMGETDFVVIARLPDSDKVERLIRDFEAIDEVERTNSTFVVKPLRDNEPALRSYSIETLIDELTTED